MTKLTRSDLLTLEAYAAERPAFRARVLAHKRSRQLPIGPHATLYFEDRLTIHYQVQEMLRIERIFEANAIEEELEAYNPLIPDGRNLKATFMLEYPDADERRAALASLGGIEDRVWIRVRGCDAVFAIADEDLERRDEERTAAVHFLRFELNDAMASRLAAGSPLAAGIDFDRYRHQVDPVNSAVRDSLAGDLA